MAEFLTIGYHSGRLGSFVVIWSSNNFAQPPLFFQVFRHSLSESAGYAGFLIGPVILGVITLGLGIAGAVLGIQAIRKQDPKRGFAIAGLALNFICLCPFLLLILLMLVSGVSSIPALIQQGVPSFGP